MTLFLWSNGKENSLFHTVGYKNHSVGYIFYTVKYKFQSAVQRKHRQKGKNMPVEMKE